MKDVGKNYRFNIIWWPFFFNEEYNNKLDFIIPKIKFHSYKNKPCSTNWNYDWDFTFIYLTVMKKQKRGSIYNMIEKVFEINRKNGDYTHNKIIIPKSMYDIWIFEQHSININYTSNFWGIEVVPGDVENIMFV